MLYHIRGKTVLALEVLRLGRLFKVVVCSLLPIIPLADAWDVGMTVGSEELPWITRWKRVLKLVEQHYRRACVPDAVWATNPDLNLGQKLVSGLSHYVWGKLFAAD